MNESKKYTCAQCGETYTKGWTDEEANEEAQQLWGIVNASNKLSSTVAVICDDCFQIIQTKINL